MKIHSDHMLLTTALWAGLVLGLIDPTTGYQKPRDGYNTFSDTSTSPPSSALNVIMNPKWTEPYFDISMPKNVTALVGKSAYLGCRVRNLGNRTVSWIRHRDLHILTVATYTYTTDQRFQTTFHRDVNEWTMQIKWAQQRDAGMYECQISSQPIKSYSVHLNVVDPPIIHARPSWPAPDNPLNRAYNDAQAGGSIDSNEGDTGDGAWTFRSQPFDNTFDPRRDYYADTLWPPATVPSATILGGPDLYVDKGSNINLTCSIRFSPEPPAYIFWYHQDKVISYDAERGRITVRTAKSESTTSYLLISNADLNDSGKYSCAPSNTDMTSIRVHVLNGERPEAMQTSSASSTHPTPRFNGFDSLTLLSVVLTSIIWSHFRTVHNVFVRRPTRMTQLYSDDDISPDRPHKLRSSASDGQLKCVSVWPQTMRKHLLGSR